MTQDEFVAEVASILQVEADVLKPSSELKQFEGWDSTAVINLIVLLDEQGAEVDEDKIPECETVQDIIALAGDNLDS